MEYGGGVSRRFSCVTSEEESWSQELPQARWCSLVNMFIRLSPSRLVFVLLGDDAALGDESGFEGSEMSPVNKSAEIFWKI